MLQETVKNDDDDDVLDVSFVSNFISRRHSNDSDEACEDTNPLIQNEGTENERYCKRHLTALEIIALNMTYIGLNMMFLLLSVEVVPAQVEAIVGSAFKGITLGIIVAAGAVVTFILGPLIGMTSDRLVSRHGRRRPIIFIGVVAFCVSVLLLVIISPSINSSNEASNSSSCISVNLTQRRCNLAHNKSNNKVEVRSDNIYRIWAYIPCYLIVISSYITTITPYNALIADKSHPEQRGISSGAMGGMILLGNIFGAVLGLLIIPIGSIGTVCIGFAVLLICVVITTTRITELPSTPEEHSLTCSDKIQKFWLPLKDNDFRWLFITRFLMQQGLTSVIGFLEYWVKDMIELPPCWSTYKAVSCLLLPLLIVASISSLVHGIISDKTGRRKIILVVNSIIMAIVVIILAFIKGPNAYFVSMFLTMLFGMSLGGFQAIDFALLMDVIPNEKEQSLMIAVWHQAMVLPQALAVPIAGLIVDLFNRVNCSIGLGYIILMNVIAVYFLLSGCFIRKIKGAR